MKAIYIASCHLNERRGREEYQAIVEVEGRCLYRNGEFSIYKHLKDAYYLLWRNVIIGEYTGVNKELTDALAMGVQPEEGAKKYNYLRGMEDIKEAPMWAEKYGFEIEN